MLFGRSNGTDYDAGESCYPKWEMKDGFRLTGGYRADTTTEPDCYFSCWDELNCLAADYSYRTGACMFHMHIDREHLRLDEDAYYVKMDRSGCPLGEN